MADRKRFFVNEIHGDTAYLTGEEFTHARTVLRLEVGSEVILLDNSGMEYVGIVTDVSKKEIAVHIVDSYQGDKEPSVDVRLLFGFLKNADKNEFIVQKATELGVNQIGVFSSAYSSAYLSDNKVERLRRVAQEAAKQCGRSKAPTITVYNTLKEGLNAGMGYTNKVFACEFFHENQTDLTTLAGDTVIVVGSEGGFSSEEFALSQELGYKGITLGKRILRAETAAVALTSVVMFALGELR